MAGNLLAEISRSFLKQKQVYRHNMRKVAEMSDADVISFCHAFCEENHLADEWNHFRDSVESQYCYCSCLREFVEPGFCCDMQMIACGYIKETALPEINIDKEQLQKCCKDCIHRL